MASVIVRHMSKRARVSQAATSNTQAAAAATATAAASLPEAPLLATNEKSLLLWFCDKQWQARLMTMAAGAQMLLGVAYTDSLYLVKRKLAEDEKLTQMKEGFKDVTLSKLDFLDFMTLWDYGLTATVWAAPFLLLLATRYSTSRWVHSLTLLPNSMVELVHYNIIGARTKMTLPVASVMRGKIAKRLYVDGKIFMLPETGKFFEKDVFERVFKKRD